MFENENYNIFTVGHSDYRINEFIHLLKKFNINCLIDIRSSPYSKHVPHFNRYSLMNKLFEHDIRYFFLGDKLGARYNDLNLLSQDGKVNFKKVRSTQNFKSGIEKLFQIAQTEDRIVLMCSEKDPLYCHRFSLVSYQLKKEGTNVKHICKNGKLINNNKLEERLLKKFKIDPKQSKLNGIETEEGGLEEAYEKINKQIAYVNENIAYKAQNIAYNSKKTCVKQMRLEIS